MEEGLKEDFSAMASFFGKFYCSKSANWLHSAVLLQWSHVAWLWHQVGFT
jgi:hypothetical protein